MATIIANIVIALISLIGTLIGAYKAVKTSTNITTYRLEQLEKKVDKHNNLIERTYRIEERNAVFDEEIKVANHRITDLEELHKRKEF